MAVNSGASRSRPNRLTDFVKPAQPKGESVSSRPSSHSCLSFVRGEGHTLWLEGSHPFCEVLSLSATGGLLSLPSEKRGVPHQDFTPVGLCCLVICPNSYACFAGRFND